MIPGRAAVTATATGVAVGGISEASTAANDLESTSLKSLTGSVGANTENNGTSISKGGDKPVPLLFREYRLNIALIQIFSWFLLAYIKYIAYICKRKPIVLRL